MTDSLIKMYDRGFERDSIVWIAISRENWLKISDRVTQLRQELSLAEEGLANYQQEMENAKHDIERLTAAASAEATEIERLRAALERIKAYPVGTFRPLEDECTIWRIANDALQPEPQDGEHK